MQPSRSRPPVVQLAAVLVLSLQATGSNAMGLIQAFEAALQNDPTYRAAVYENEAGQYYRAMGRASLLPSLSLSYSASNSRANTVTTNSFGDETEDQPRYDSRVGSLSLRQPILNLDGVARYYQGIAQTDYSAAVFSVRQQELVLRLVTAYADAQYAQDQLVLAQAQSDTYDEQIRVTARLYQLGEGTRTDLLETQARRDMTEAQVIEARDNVVNTRLALAAMIGTEPGTLAPLSDAFRIERLEPAGVEAWKAMALTRNAEIVAQTAAVEAALQEWNRNRAGHAPRLDFVASYNRNEAGSIYTYNQKSTERTLGLQLTIPLFAGGYVSAASSQALANHGRATAELEAKTRQVEVELRKQYALVQSGTARIDALVKAEESARLLVLATRKSIAGGVRINLDLLNAQQQWTMSRRDLIQARYNWLLAGLRLRNAAGTLGADDVRAVAGYFIAVR